MYMSGSVPSDCLGCMVKSRGPYARGLLGIAALLVIGCVDTERDVPVEFEIEDSDKGPRAVNVEIV